MSHSKRNTSLAFFTSYERSLLRSTWGSQASRLSRDSFLPFGSCQLCLLPAREPLACASEGDIFCRECAVSNLLSQHKEIHRLEKESAKQRAEEQDLARKEDEEAQERAVKEFEAIQMGLQHRLGRAPGSTVVGRGGGKVVVEDEVTVTGTGGKKRKFCIDEDELLRIAREDRTNAKRSIGEEKAEASKPALPSFWIPSQTPNAEQSRIDHGSKPGKLHPVCPASSEESIHHYSLKTLVEINFTEIQDSQTQQKVPSCPSCRKALSNATKAMLTIPCGHVICKPCASTFMISQHDSKESRADMARETMRCFVCETDLGIKTGDSGQPAGRVKKPDKTNDKKKNKSKLSPGLIQIKSGGTGFAGGGQNLIKKEGVAFQC